MNETYPDLKQGDRIGKYKVLRKLAGGASGAVYLAEHKFTKRKVAIKLILTQNDDMLLQWAHREAELLASIDHPSIVRLYDADEYEGHFYLAVDFIEGKSLWEAITSKDTLPITVVIKLMLDLVDAIGYLHSRGVIFADIKPANIMISSDGIPVLVDLLLASIVESKIPEGTVIGTPRYMAPESWQRLWDKRSDLWSLGMIFHHVLTGRLPFEADDYGAIRQIVVSEKPLDLSVLHRTVPKPVARIIERCLQKSLNERYQSATELRRDLESALAYLELGQADETLLDIAPLSAGKTIMLNVDYKEPGIPGQYREYRIVEKLGQGASAIVYRAEDVIGNRQVALKIHRREKAGGEENLVRFRQEASLLARLDDPNIVHVYNFGRYVADFFIVMEVLTGPTLKMALECGFEFQMEGSVAVVAQILAGLERIHAEGVVHRDVNPKNVNLQPERAVVMDLHLAHVGGEAQLTMSGQILGTPRYMAPEQARGDKVTFQSDLYAAGVILYELLTRRIPHEADSTTGLIFKIASEAPEPVTKYRNDLPLSLVAFLERILAHEPAERFSSTRMAYEELLTSVGLQSHNVPMIYREMFRGLKAGSSEDTLIMS